MIIRLNITVDSGRFAAEFVGGSGGGGSEDEAPATFSVPLAPSHLAGDLDDLAIMLQATSGTLTPTLRRHLEEHFARGSAPSGGCAFCKLQGRVLAGQGRRRLGEEEHAKRVIPAQGGGGAGSEALATTATFGVTRIADGATYAAAVRAERRAALRAQERKRGQVRLGGKGGTGVSGTDLEGLF